MREAVAQKEPVIVHVVGRLEFDCPEARFCVEPDTGQDTVVHPNAKDEKCPDCGMEFR